MRMNLKGFLASFAISTAMAVHAGESTQNSTSSETPAQRAKRMAWFNEARFGMFIHWGLYSVPAGEWQGNPVPSLGEWIMQDAKIPASEYEKFAQQFNPVKFDAREWVRMAKDAGMKYIVITSKHHDGFAMFRSDLSDWGIKSTPFQRDPLKELADACHKAGIKLCFYYSIMDWHHPDWPERRAWNDTATGTPKMDRYVAYMKGQLRELLTRYGPIGILWFDGEWEKPWTNERGVDLYNYVRSLQPDIIVNNRVGKGREGMSGMNKGEGVGDYGTPEQEIPPNGFGPGVNWESCMTMNDTWGYRKDDHKWKPEQTLVRNLIDCASKGGNYLLNIGPTSEGVFPDASIERLKEIGEWTRVNGEGIYGTTASPFKQQLSWGRCTQKDRNLYLHVFDWPATGQLRVPLSNKKAKAWLLADPHHKLDCDTDADGLIIELPPTAPDKIASVVVLHLSSAADEINTLNLNRNLPLKREYQERQERVNKWYVPARFGLFCHWGLFTGGGDVETDEARSSVYYNTVAEFEAVAKDPKLIASNLVATTKRMGARYLTFTLLHSGDRYTVMFPAKTPGFKMKTTKDYVGALAARCQQEHVPLMLYLCGGGEHGFNTNRGGPWLEESLRDPKKYVEATKGLLDELATRFPGKIAGFWIDGNPSDLPVYMRQHFPGCIVIHNNDDYFGWGSIGDPNIDYGTTEFLSGPADPDYSRPTGLVKTEPRWDLLAPSRDYNEDIPSVGSWWYKPAGPDDDGYQNSRYAKNPTFIVKQMVSSLGQRREWNFAIGIGPMIDGRFPATLDPMVENLHNYFAWAAESIYDTIGGEGSALKPGWWNRGAYGSVTVSRKNPRVLYVHVTTAPKSSSLRVPNNGYKVASVVDLRTGNPVKFIDIGVLIVQNQDWSDVETYGDKVFKVTLAGTP